MLKDIFIHTLSLSLAVLPIILLSDKGTQLIPLNSLEILSLVCISIQIAVLIEMKYLGSITNIQSESTKSF